MHILHIMPNAATLTETRLYKEIRSSLRAGVATRCTILALDFDGSLPARETTKDGVEIVRVKRPLEKMPRGGVFAMLRLIGTFQVQGKAAAALNPDIIHAHSLFGFASGVIAKRLTKAPLLYDCHELETETLASKGRIKQFKKWLERSRIAQADEIFVVSPSIADWYREEYGRMPKLVRAYPDRTWQTVQDQSDRFREQFDIPKDDLVFLYQGALFNGRMIPEMLEAFRQVKADRHLVLMGYGELQEMVREAAKNAPNIHFKEAVPSNEVLSWTQSADVGVTGVEDKCLSYRYCLPNKLCEYAATGLAILTTDLVEMRRFVEERNCGWVMPNDPPAIADIVNNLTRSEVEEKKRSSLERAHEIDWKVEEPVLLDTYRALVGKRA